MNVLLTQNFILFRFFWRKNDRVLIELLHWLHEGKIEWMISNWAWRSVLPGKRFRLDNPVKMKLILYFAVIENYTTDRGFPWMLVISGANLLFQILFSWKRLRVEINIQSLLWSIIRHFLLSICVDKLLVWIFQELLYLSIVFIHMESIILQILFENRMYFPRSYRLKFLLQG